MWHSGAFASPIMADWRQKMADQPPKQSAGLPSALRCTTFIPGGVSEQEYVERMKHLTNQWRQYKTCKQSGIYDWQTCWEKSGLCRYIQDAKEGEKQWNHLMQEMNMAGAFQNVSLLASKQAFPFFQQACRRAVAEYSRPSNAPVSTLSRGGPIPSLPEPQANDIPVKSSSHVPANPVEAKSVIALDMGASMAKGPCGTCRNTLSTGCPDRCPAPSPNNPHTLPPPPPPPHQLYTNNCCVPSRYCATGTSHPQSCNPQEQQSYCQLNETDKKIVIAVVSTVIVLSIMVALICCSVRTGQE